MAFQGKQSTRKMHSAERQPKVHLRTCDHFLHFCVFDFFGGGGVVINICPAH
jgi:hypothetical protein